MDWDTHAATWPLAKHSQFIHCAPHRWHVQEMGSGPLILLIHGAGGATQSWRHLMPLLAETHHVIAIDLPGQGFTKRGAQGRCGLSQMAEDLNALLRHQEWEPQVLIGHSAGAAIALQMTLGRAHGPAVIGINAALGNFKGLAGVLFPLMAKALAMTPWVAHIFTASTNRRGSVERLIAGTGSTLSDNDLQWYRALVSDRSHVDATLAMMAQWDLTPLLRSLHQHPARTLLIAADNDKTVPPKVSLDAAQTMPNAEFISLHKLGHLAHEEDANAVHAALHPFLEGLKSGA